MVYLMLANGFEEVEALAPLDILRRAEIEVKTIGISERIVTSSHGVPVQADILPQEADIEHAEMIILPGGGPGTQNLYESNFVKDAVLACAARDIYIAAICAAPSVILGGMGLLKGKRATCFPGMESGMTDAVPQDSPVCIDGKIITGRAAGAAFDFGLALCKALKGEAAAEAVRQKIHYVCN